MKNGLTGNKFHSWTVLSHSHYARPHQYYNCQCECGELRVVQANSLKTGTSKGCGCTKRLAISVARTKHGLSNHPAYQNWSSMKARCDPNDENFSADYAERGIVVCAKWQTFQAFWEDMGPTWKSGLTLDRIDNNGNYEPGNVRWATHAEQNRNKRNTVMVNSPWGRMIRADAAKLAGISVGSLIHRMNAGWPEETWFLPPSK